MDQASIQRNIRKAWSCVSEGDLEMGLRAYPAYRETLRGMADFYGTPFVATVEAFVALSPNNDYHGNLRSLASLLRAWHEGRGSDWIISTYNGCGTRAWSYLTGEVSFLDTVKGRKITAFRHNILYPETSRLVTVDGHMVAIGHGKKLNMKQANFALREGNTYDDVQATILGLRRKAKLPIPAIQATLWTWRKRTQRIRFDGQIDMFTGTTNWDGVIPPDKILPYD